jgi:hypothetical protein
VIGLAVYQQPSVAAQGVPSGLVGAGMLHARMVADKRDVARSPQAAADSSGGTGG